MLDNVMLCDGVLLEVSGGSDWMEIGAMGVREGDVMYCMEVCGRGGKRPCGVEELSRVLKG